MGNSQGTSISAQDFILVLQTERCVPSHQIWKQIDLDDLGEFRIEQATLDDMIILRDQNPSNFIELVACTSLGLSKVVQIYITGIPNYLAIQRFLWLARLLLSVPEDSQTMQPWFRPNASYTASFVPYSLFFQSAFALLTIPTNLHPPHDLSLVKLDTIETLLFFMYSPFICNKDTNEPTKHLICFESFQPFEFLNLLFSGRIISNITHPLCVLAIPCIYYCKLWKYAFNALDIEVAHSFLLKNINSQEFCYITLMYCMASVIDKFQESYVSPKYARQYTQKLLQIYHEIASKKHHHLVQFMVIIMLKKLMEFQDVSTPCSQCHANKLSDLAIESITDPIMYDFNESKKLIPISISLICDLISKVDKISGFINSRILLVIDRFIDSNSCKTPEFGLLCNCYNKLIQRSETKLDIENEQMQIIQMGISIKNQDLPSIDDTIGFINLHFPVWVKQMAIAQFPQDFSRHRLESCY